MLSICPWPFLALSIWKGPLSFVLDTVVEARRLLIKVIVVLDIKLNIVFDFGFNFTSPIFPAYLPGPERSGELCDVCYVSSL